MSMLKRVDESTYQVFDHGVQVGVVQKNVKGKWQIQGQNDEFHSRSAATVALFTGDPTREEF